MESVDSGERNGERRERRRRRRRRLARARALHYSFGIFIAAGSGSVRPSAPASSFRQRYCLFKFRVRVCARTHAPSSLPLSPPEQTYSLKINFFSFAVESLEGPDLGLRRLTRADMGAYLVPDSMACRYLREPPRYARRVRMSVVRTLHSSRLFVSQ